MSGQESGGFGPVAVGTLQADARAVAAPGPRARNSPSPKPEVRRGRQRPSGGLGGCPAAALGWMTVLLLAFDTATPAVTVALHDGSRVIAEESAVDARRHGELLAVAIAEVLRSAGAGHADLTHVAVGTGPGPYTGLRAGLVTATVLASALGIPADGICSLDVIAAAADADGEFLVATDARRREVYWARYDRNGGRRDGPARRQARGAAGRSSGGRRGRGAVSGARRPRRCCRGSLPPASSPRSRSRASRPGSRPSRPSRCTCGGQTPGSRARPSGSPSQPRQAAPAGRCQPDGAQAMTAEPVPARSPARSCG